MARATSSLPVPRSPVTSTVALAFAGARDLLAQLDHGAALPDELAGLPGLRPERVGLGLGADQAQRVLEDQEQPIGRERLLQEVDGPERAWRAPRRRRWRARSS